MGNIQTNIKIGFEDMQKSLNNNIIINTLDSNEQTCLIKNTVNYQNEEHIINNLLANNDKNKYIIIYGKNSCDNSMFYKYEQLSKLGFTNIYIYVGGLFEWMLLQDIYGFDNFPTTSTELDILKHRQKSSI